MRHELRFRVEVSHVRRWWVAQPVYDLLFPLALSLGADWLLAHRSYQVKHA